MITIPEEQVEKAFAAATQEVRDLIEEGVVSHTVLEVTKIHGLHVDVVGNVAQLATYMLLGLVGPAQFVTELKGVGVPEATANTIVQDLNEKLFKPLFEQMKDTSKKEPVKLTPTTAAPTIPPQATLSSKIPSLPIAPPAPVTKLPPLKVPEPVVPTIPAIPKSIPIALPTVAPQIPPMRTMAHDVQEMQTGKTPVPFTPPLPVPPPVSIPTPPPVVPVLPSYPPIPTHSAPVPESTTHLSAPTKDELSHSLKEYGIDPYREPVE